MAKKVKKSRTPVKEKTVEKYSSKAAKEEGRPSVETVENGLSAEKERMRCQHLDKEADLSKLSEKINGTDPVRCEDCRESCGDRRGNKGKGKQGKKKVGNGKSDSKAIWVCLVCGHYACGGVGLPTNPQSHAARHARQTRHPLVIQFENTGLRWCFSCNLLIPIEKTKESGGEKDVFAEAVKLIKGRSSKGASTDVEDIWFEAGSVTSGIKPDGASSSALDGKAGYKVRGLSNLGNTCFFNSVTQNLLSISRLRDYFLNLDESIGPLTISLKKLYGETNPDAGLKGVINPRSFFGTLCSKAPQFKGYQQHDSHELLRCLLDSLCMEELGARKRSNSFQGDHSDPGPIFVDAVFGGEISSTVSCVECSHSSTVYEPFLDLSLPVPTKKPPSKQSQSSSRAKKTKVPPKKGGKTRPKVNKNSYLVAPQNAPDMSSRREPSDQAHSTIPDSKEIVASSSDSTMLARTTSTNSCTDKDFSVFQSDEQQGVGKSTQNIPLCDDSTWLDFMEAAPVSDEQNWTSQDDQISGPQNFASDPLDNDQAYGESTNFSTALCDDSGWLDYMEPSTVPDNQDSTPQEIQHLDIKDFSNKNIIQDDGLVESGCASGSHVHSLGQGLNQQSNSNADHWEDEIPLQVKDSEVLLLPYKEEASSNCDIVTGEVEAPSSLVGCEQDNADFDGFGDLFSEPEVAGPSIKPLLSNGNSQNNDVAESSFIGGNSTESDPDEVDNANAPVSVESCLAYFIKPELLCDDNAWHCENCSRILWQQQIEAKKRTRNASKSLINGGEASVQNDMPDVDNDVSHPKELKNINDKNVGCSNSFMIKGETSPSNSRKEDNLNVYSMRASAQDLKLKSVDCQEEDIDMNGVQETTSSSSCYKTCDEESLSDQPNGSSGAYEPSSNMHDTNEVRLIGPQLPADYDSEEGEDDKVEAITVKVKRNATKRVLINKVPPILTIHLKRFSQDARGRLNKLNGHVVFREIIDLRPYLDSRTADSEKHVYRLVGVVEHMGSMRGGHYVAYVRGEKRMAKSENEIGDSVWYHASDAYVREVSIEEVFRCEAYILFYEKM